MYSYRSNSLNAGTFSDCFLAFSYENIGPCVNCSDFNSTGVSMIFANNQAPLTGSASQIFGSAFHTCYWAIDLLTSLSLPLTTPILPLLVERFPDTFIFDTALNSPENFRTQAHRLNVDIPEADNMTTRYSVLPGEVFNISAAAIDNFNQTVRSFISSVVFPNASDLDPQQRSTVGSNNFWGLIQDVPTEDVPVSISAMEGKNLTVFFYSTDSRAHTSIEVSIGYCGGVFVFENVTNQCVCNPELERFGIACNTSDQTFTVPEGKWVGPIDDEGRLGVANCRDGFCALNNRSNRVRVINGTPQFDDQCISGNENLFRRGVLCSECQEGRSFVLGSQRCLKCTNVSILLYVLFLILGVAIVIIIYYLDITIAEGVLNGAIFFSNLVTIYSVFLFPSTFGGANYIWLVSFLSLNFGIEACLHAEMSGLERLWWQLSFPLYLFALMVIVWIIAECTPLFNKMEVLRTRLSVPRLFTTLLILCYVSVLQVCVQILGVDMIETIDGGTSVRWAFDASVVYFTFGHIPMVLFAVVLMIIYLIPFPFFLMFPRIVFKIRFLGKRKPYYDPFWQPFEPNYRFWVGLRLIWRWIPFLLSFLVPSPIGLFVTDLFLIILLYVEVLLKPFKKSWVNIIDTLFMCLLVLMFTGTLFFDALARNGNSDPRLGATIYNQILVVIAFMLMLGLFFYHLAIRFPKLKELLLKAWHRMRGNKDQYDVQESTNEPKNESEAKPDPSQEAPVKTKAPTQTMIDVSQLREPLLDDEEFASSVVMAPKTTPSDTARNTT